MMIQAKCFFCVCLYSHVQTKKNLKQASCINRAFLEDLIAKRLSNICEPAGGFSRCEKRSLLTSHPRPHDSHFPPRLYPLYTRSCFSSCTANICRVTLKFIFRKREGKMYVFCNPPSAILMSLQKWLYFYRFRNS